MRSLLLLIAVFSPPLFAVPVTENTATLASSGQPPISIGMALLSLLLVLALIIGLGWLAKRLRLPFHGKGSIQIEQQQALGQRERLLIVNVEGQRLLIGVTPQNISLLSHLNSVQEEGGLANGTEATSQTAATTAATVTTANSLRGGFAQHLRAAMQSRVSGTAPAANRNTASNSAATPFHAKHQSESDERS
ncbi:MAG: flagellar biosynthetic protein FliO [Plesiomonas sp.]